MKTGYTIIIATMLALIALAPLESQGQVDPAWLESWNDALERRPAEIGASSRIAPESESGIPLTIIGRVVLPDGSAAAGVLVHAYHRDDDGVEFDSQNAVRWLLEGWARTDKDGRFEFRTIRPAPDNLGREGAHIHFTLVSDEFGKQWAPKVFFADDPQVPARERRRSGKAGEFGWVRVAETTDSGQTIRVNLRLKAQPDF